VTKEAFPPFRKAAFLYTLVYYLVCLLVFNSSIQCDSAVFTIRQHVIVFLCGVCMVVVASAWALEELALRGKVDKFMKKGSRDVYYVRKKLQSSRHETRMEMGDVTQSTSTS
jgi:hypothetical protein